MICCARKRSDEAGKPESGAVRRFVRAGGGDHGDGNDPPGRNLLRAGAGKHDALPVLVLCGEKLSWAMFFASAMLSLLLAPDKEAAAIFLALGYYPIVKPKLDRKSKIRRWVGKFLLFNVSILAVYAVLLFVLRLDALREEFSAMSGALLAGLLLGGNFLFWLDDRLLGRFAPRAAALCARWEKKHR